MSNVYADLLLVLLGDLEQNNYSTTDMIKNVHPKLRGRAQ